MCAYIVWRSKKHKSCWLEKCAQFNKRGAKQKLNEHMYKGCTIPKLRLHKSHFKKKEYSLRGPCWSLWPSHCFNIGNKLRKGKRIVLTLYHQRVVPSPKKEKWHKYFFIMISTRTTMINMITRVLTTHITKRGSDYRERVQHRECGDGGFRSQLD